jgi:predicted RNase H-like nuclease
MQRNADAVLGIDAAWTDSAPSGIALLERNGARWTALRVAPSGAAFCNAFGWSDHFPGAVINVRELVEASENLLTGSRLSVVAIDMPLSTTRIDKRRCADQEVSRRFGHCKCAVHSPTLMRPGGTGRRLQKGFEKEGFSLVTTGGSAVPALIEVYPHVALLGLTGRPERLPYKAGKTTTYWQGKDIETRKQMLITEWRFILDCLRKHIDNIDLPLPDPAMHSLSSLKRYEDALDGLICAWVATQFLAGTAIALGDETATIWIPKPSMPFAKDHHGT